MHVRGRYLTREDLYSALGAKVFDADQVQRAIDEADAEIISEGVKAGFYQTPLAPAGNDVQRVHDWSLSLIAEKVNGSIENKRRADDARNEMRLALSSGELNATRRSLKAPGSQW